MHRAKALTIVEMLVVLGICGVLALLLVPALFHARTSARSAVCADRLKAVGQNYALCLMQSNGVLPSAYYTLAGSEGSYQVALLTIETSQPDALLVGEISGALTCPSDDRPAAVLGRNAVGTPAMIPASYAYNVALPAMYKNVSRVVAPVNTVTFYDGDPTAVVGPWSYAADWASSTVRPRHEGKVNYLYLDGHVLRPDQFPSAAFDTGDRWLALQRNSNTAWPGVQPGIPQTQPLNPNSQPPDPDPQPPNKHHVVGIININPSNSSNNEFSMTLPDGFTVTRDDLKNGDPISRSGFSPSQLEYSGPAATVIVRPKGNGNQNGLTMDGDPYPLANSTRYTIASSNMTVHLFNDKYKSNGGQPMGKWWIEIVAEKATIAAD